MSTSQEVELIRTNGWAEAGTTPAYRVVCTLCFQRLLQQTLLGQGSLGQKGYSALQDPNVSAGTLSMHAYKSMRFEAGQYNPSISSINVTVL